MRKLARSLLAASVALPLTAAAAEISPARAACGPCKPRTAHTCKAKKPRHPCAAKKMNPCAAHKMKSPCNPCAPK